MAKRRMGIILALLCFCLCRIPCFVNAASTADAKEPISPERECTLTIAYRCDGRNFENLPVKLYQIARISEDFQYTLTEEFAASGLILNGIQTNGEWNVIRETLEAYILANNPEADREAVTNLSGEVCFETLETGLYLAIADYVVQGDFHCYFIPALVSLPALGQDGYWQYQVAVAAKPEVLPPIEPDEELQFKVVKLWKGDEGRTDRPVRVEVEIFRNGRSYETVILSKENQWCYSWTVPNDGASWKVIEQNVPAGYTLTLEKRGTAFILTNTWTPEDPDVPPPPPPQTGDTSNILLYVVLMYVSGGMLVFLSIMGKRRHR